MPPHGHPVTTWKRSLYWAGLLAASALVGLGLAQIISSPAFALSPRQLRAAALAFQLVAVAVVARWLWSLRK